MYRFPILLAAMFALVVVCGPVGCNHGYVKSDHGEASQWDPPLFGNMDRTAHAMRTAAEADDLTTQSAINHRRENAKVDALEMAMHSKNDAVKLKALEIVQEDEDRKYRTTSWSPFFGGDSEGASDPTIYGRLIPR